MTRKWLVLVAIVSMLIVVVAGCAPAAPPPAPPPVAPPPVAPPPVAPVERIVWKDAEYTIPASTISWGTMWFYDEVVRRSEGRFEIQYFLSSSLCPAREQPDGLKSGLFQATHICPAYYPSKFPLYNLGYLPCLFPFTKDNKEEWLTFMNIMNEWLDTPPLKKEFAGWNAMRVWEDYPTYYNIMGTVRIANLEDIKGKKIRAISGTADLLKKAGAAVVYTTAPDIYDALSKGVIEAAAHAWTLFYPYKVYEVSDYWTPGINLGQIPYCGAVSIKDYEALPEDIKKVFQEVSKEYPGVLTDYWTTEKPKFVEAFKKAGIEFVEFSAEDNAKLIEMSQDIWKEKVDKLEKDGLPAREAFNSLQDIIKKYVSDFEPYKL